MFFVASKLLWFVVTPSNLLPLAGLLALLVGWRRIWGRVIAGLSLLAVLVVGLSPLPLLVAAPLEDRFPSWRDGGRPLAGIIVLGGGVESADSMLRGQLLLNDAGERMVAMGDLARRFPQVRMIFSGGPANIDGSLYSESAAVERFQDVLGLAPGRVVYEGRSRNTRENAVFTAEIAPPKPGERWLLVTSAFHMPRAVGCFRAVGYDVVAYPVDYRTSPGAYGWFRNAADGWRLLDIATKEWVGLVAYRLAGYTDALWPSP